MAISSTPALTSDQRARCPVHRPWGLAHEGAELGSKARVQPRGAADTDPRSADPSTGGPGGKVVSRETQCISLSAYF